MPSRLKEHQERLKSKVNSWDLISIGLGLAGGLCFISAIVQPKHSLNGARYLFAVGLGTASVLVERARESDLFDLDKAIDFEANIKKEWIKLEAGAKAEVRRLEIAEEAFAAIPVDRHQELSAKLGINPPNYAARQADSLMQSATATQNPQAETKLPDPTGDFDPESQSEQKDSGMMLIPSDRVSEWFDHMGDLCPDSLRKEWTNNPGKAIEIIDGVARVLR